MLLWFESVATFVSNQSLFVYRYRLQVIPDTRHSSDCGRLDPRRTRGCRLDRLPDRTQESSSSRLPQHVNQAMS